MNKIVFLVMILTSVSIFAQAKDLTGDSANKLFKALIQTDVKTQDTKAPNRDYPGHLMTVDQQVGLKNLNCATSYSEMGIMVGSCSAKDMAGRKVSFGSAASDLLMQALPEEFVDGATGHFTAKASLVKCEVDIRKVDSSGTAITTCTVL